MKLIKEERLNRKIAKQYSYDFKLNEGGIYLIEITARVKSWWQNLKSFRLFLGDDDLAIKIDRTEFPKQDGRRGLFDGEMAWNGNKLCGLLKTGLCATFLSKGNHIILFLNDGKPIIENIKISKIEEGNKIIYIPINNNPAESGDRRPWISLAVIDFGIKSLKIKAKAGVNKSDDDDIKLIINGEIQKNNILKAHKYWYWCGKILKGKNQEFSKILNLRKGSHYIELWADGSPFMEKIEVEIEELDNKQERIPTVEDPKWTSDFYDDPAEIILARLVFGEADGQPREAKVWVAWSIINRIEANSWWPHTIHEVILQANQFDPFKTTDKNFLKITDPLGFKEMDQKTKKSWQESYEIAEEVILRKTNNPTKATHFHGIGVTRDWFEKKVVPNGKFLKKIGDTYFYWSPN